MWLLQLTVPAMLLIGAAGGDGASPIDHHDNKDIVRVQPLPDIGAGLPPMLQIDWQRLPDLLHPVQMGLGGTATVGGRPPTM